MYLALAKRLFITSFLPAEYSLQTYLSIFGLKPIKPPLSGEFVKKFFPAGL
jgi:hypothetical protein